MSWLGHCPSALSQLSESKGCAKHRLFEKYTISPVLAPEGQRGWAECARAGTPEPITLLSVAFPNTHSLSCCRRASDHAFFSLGVDRDG